MHGIIRTGLIALTFALLAPAAWAASFTLTLQNHRFQPAELTLPAHQRVKLVIVNRDPAAEEFESHDLGVEKLIPGRSRATVWVGPLAPGSYAFYGEFHESTARGKLIVKQGG